MLSTVVDKGCRLKTKNLYWFTFQLIIASYNQVDHCDRRGARGVTMTTRKKAALKDGSFQCCLEKGNGQKRSMWLLSRVVLWTAPLFVQQATKNSTEMLGMSVLFSYFDSFVWVIQSLWLSCVSTWCKQVARWRLSKAMSLIPKRLCKLQLKFLP